MTRQVTTSSVLLATFFEAGVLDLADVHAARRLGLLVGEKNESVWLATALAIRALRLGSVCIDLAAAASADYDLDEHSVDTSTLPWPEPTAWLTAVSQSPLTTVGENPERGVLPLRLVDGLLYLERYWGYQESVRQRLLQRAATSITLRERLAAASVLDELFDRRGLAPDEPDLQRSAAEHVLSSPVTVIAGGPGTGKTTTVARILAALSSVTSREPRIALAAPTGKAAVRMEEALHEQIPLLPERFREGLSSLQATTVHRLLGWRPDSSTRFLHDATNPLPYDVVIVDESSMVALPLMARLLEATAPEARLVLVGDPDQLASVEVGAVLADIVSGLPQHVVVLRKSWRFGSDIAALSDAVRSGEVEQVHTLLQRPYDHITLSGTDPLLEPSSLEYVHELVLRQGQQLLTAARAGDAHAALSALDQHRILCAHRQGPYGVASWGPRVEGWLRDGLEEFHANSEWYLGRPVLITKNDRHLDLANGDTGVAIATATGLGVAFARGESVRIIAPGLLDSVQTLHAMTIHKSQGSQFDAVTVILPPEDSPLLTRQLCYTAMTRTKTDLLLLGPEKALLAAVAKPAPRASGLSQRLTVAAAD